MGVPVQVSCSPGVWSHLSVPPSAEAALALLGHWGTQGSCSPSEPPQLPPVESSGGSGHRGEHSKAFAALPNVDAVQSFICLAAFVAPTEPGDVPGSGSGCKQGIVIKSHCPGLQAALQSQAGHRLLDALAVLSRVMSLLSPGNGNWAFPP